MSSFDKSSRTTDADTRATRSFTADMHYMVYTFFCCYSSACRSPPAPMSVMSNSPMVRLAPVLKTIYHQCVHILVASLTLMAIEPSE